MASKQSFKERIKEFIKSEHISQSKLEKLCGFSNGYINNIKSTPGADKIEVILRVFPHLNSDWLLTGEGEMLRQHVVNQTNSHGDNIHGSEVTVTKVDSALFDVIRKKDEQIDRLLTIIEKMQEN